MAHAVEPRPRRSFAAFAIYFLLVLALAWYLSPTVAGYLMPSATLPIMTAFVLLAAVALAGICAGALRSARRLDERIDVLQAAQVRARSPHVRVVGGPEEARARVASGVVDSGSAEHEVNALLDGLHELSASATLQDDVYEETDGIVESTAPAADELVLAEARRMDRLRAARRAVAATVAGPAVAAIALLGMFAPLLPAADGMLLADLPLNAFLSVLGTGWLVGIAVYGAVAARQLGRASR